jgi:hypothetical protein
MRNTIRARGFQPQLTGRIYASNQTLLPNLLRDRFGIRRESIYAVRALPPVLITICWTAGRMPELRIACTDSQRVNDARRRAFVAFPSPRCPRCACTGLVPGSSAHCSPWHAVIGGLAHRGNNFARSISDPTDHCRSPRWIVGRQSATAATSPSAGNPHVPAASGCGYNTYV